MVAKTENQNSPTIIDVTKTIRTKNKLTCNPNDQECNPICGPNRGCYPDCSPHD